MGQLYLWMELVMGGCNEMNLLAGGVDLANGEDNDGCSDSGILITKDRLKIDDKIYFYFNKSSLQKRSNALLDDATLDAPVEECDDKKNASGDGYDEGSFFELCGDSPLKNGSIFFFHFD